MERRTQKLRRGRRGKFDRQTATGAHPHRRACCRQPLRNRCQPLRLDPLHVLPNLRAEPPPPPVKSGHRQPFAPAKPGHTRPSGELPLDDRPPPGLPLPSLRRAYPPPSTRPRRNARPRLGGLLSRLRSSIFPGQRPRNISPTNLIRRAESPPQPPRQAPLVSSTHMPHRTPRDTGSAISETPPGTTASGGAPPGRRCNGKTPVSSPG